MFTNNKIDENSSSLQWNTSMPSCSTHDEDFSISNNVSQKQGRRKLVKDTQYTDQDYGSKSTWEKEAQAYTNICYDSIPHPDISAMSVLSLYQNESNLDSEMDTSR